MESTNEAKSIETYLNNALTKISYSMGHFTIDSTSDTIQHHIKSIITESRNAKDSYNKGLQLKQTARRESAGFEQDDNISQLLSEIDTTILKIKTAYNTIQKIETDACQTLKKVQQRERRKTTIIIISIIAILLLVVVFIRK